MKYQVKKREEEVRVHPHVPFFLYSVNLALCAVNKIKLN